MQRKFANKLFVPTNIIQFIAVLIESESSSLTATQALLIFYVTKNL